jgi:glyoxylase-like metal-dependent hydrolase (beta-lactamase superfamily II)
MNIMTSQTHTRRAFLNKGLALSPAVALSLALPSALGASAAGPGSPQGPGAPTPGPMPVPSALPVPEAAKGPAIPQDKGYLVQEIKDGLYWVTEGVYQAMFLTTGEGVIAVDAPQTIGDKYLKAIADVTSEPVKWVIYTHTHADHIGAAKMFPATATYVAHQEVAAKLARMADPNRPLPTVTFSDHYTLKAGKQTLELAYPGPNHEPGNSFVYAPQQKVLMAVDIVFPGWVPFKNLAVSHDIPGWIAAHDAILGYGFDTLIGGHLTRLGTVDDVRTQREYVLDLKANTANALKTTDFMAIATQTGFDNPWLLFEAYLDAVAQSAAKATMDKWNGRLAAADIFTYSHAWTMQESLRIDFGGG